MKNHTIFAKSLYIVIFLGIGVWPLLMIIVGIVAFLGDTYFSDWGLFTPILIIILFAYPNWGLYKLAIKSQKSGLWMMAVSLLLIISPISAYYAYPKPQTILEEAELMKMTFAEEFFHGIWNTIISIVPVAISTVIPYGILRIEQNGKDTWRQLKDGTGFFSIYSQFLLGIILSIIETIFVMPHVSNP